MRTLRLVLAGTVALALFGGLSVGVAAQSPEGKAVWVTLVEEQCAPSDNDAFTAGSDEGVTWDRDYRLACTDTWSDPRISGSRTTVYNDLCFVEFPCVYWGTHEVVGPDGEWSGTYNGTAGPDLSSTGLAVLSGSGGYDGLTFVWHGMGVFGEPSDGFGLIYEGDPPPLP